MPSEQLASSGITNNQGWTDILGIEDGLAETLNVSESNKKHIKDISNILPPQNSPKLPDLGPSYPSPTPSNDVLISESWPKRIIKVLS